MLTLIKSEFFYCFRVFQLSLSLGFPMFECGIYPAWSVSSFTSPSDWMSVLSSENSHSKHFCSLPLLLVFAPTHTVHYMHLAHRLQNSFPFPLLLFSFLQKSVLKAPMAGSSYRPFCPHLSPGSWLVGWPNLGFLYSSVSSCCFIIFAVDLDLHQGASNYKLQYVSALLFLLFTSALSIFITATFKYPIW